MEYGHSNEGKIFDKRSNIGEILCCECGIIIHPNPTNKCVNCMRTSVDISEGIPKQAVLHFCRKCERYLQAPKEWILAPLESRELLALCLKKIKRIKDVTLVDARFIWTEAHSRRIKVKLTIHDNISDGTILRQIFIVEFVVQHQICDSCHRIEAKDFWRCMVQVRQRAENKKSLYYVEQVILKHTAHESALGIKPLCGGLDFYYANENQARKIVNFLQNTVPVKVTTSKRLISHDIRSNKFNYKYTWLVEIAPLSKDCAVCLSKKLQQKFGNVSAVCLVYKITNNIHLIDPSTTRIVEISSQIYFREPFEIICNPKQLIEYIIMDIEMNREFKKYSGQKCWSIRHVLCDVWIVRASELGINKNLIHVRSHLGHILKVGDSVLGYDFSDANINNVEFDQLSMEKKFDVVLVKKIKL